MPSGTASRSLEVCEDQRGTEDALVVCGRHLTCLGTDIWEWRMLWSTVRYRSGHRPGLLGSISEAGIFLTPRVALTVRFGVCILIHGVHVYN